MSRPRVRAGIVGAGRVAVLHLDALATMPDVEVVAIADVRLEVARVMAQRYGIRHVVDSAAGLLAHDVEVVHSCVANVAHAEVADEVLDAGLHIVAEKPLALTSTEAARLAARADEVGVQAYVCFTRRHLPAVIHLRDVAAASAGGVHLARGGYLQDWLLSRSDWDWRLDPALSGTSATVADLGGHFFDLVEFTTGSPVVSVLATLGRLHDEREVGDPPVARRVELEDHAVVMARLASGAQVSGTLSQVTAGWGDRLFVELSLVDRTLSWDYDRPGEVAVGARRAGFATELVDSEAASLKTAFFRFLPDVYRAIRGEEPSATPATFRDGWHSVRLVEAALESARTRAWVDVPAAPGGP